MKTKNIPHTRTSLCEEEERKKPLKVGDGSDIKRNKRNLIRKDFAKIRKRTYRGKIGRNE